MPERSKINKQNIRQSRSHVKTTLQELGLPTHESLASMFFQTHCMEVGQAIAHWIHTPDCSPSARTLIQDALKLNGTTANNQDAQHLFKCATCCDSNRIAKGNYWVKCLKCQ